MIENNLPNSSIYKGISKDSQKWVEGNLIREYDILDPGIIRTEIFTCSGPGKWRKQEVLPETVCQFTGIEKDGRKIWEGDLIPYIWDKTIIGVVKYGIYHNFTDDEHGGNLGFYVDWDSYQNSDKTKGMRKDLLYWLKISDVVGNLFDNKKI